MPDWLSVHTRRVLGAFVGTLGNLPGWERIFVVSPWLSSFDKDCGMSFRQFVKRLRDERPAVYVVTRPPAEAWHSEAVHALAATGSANIALLPNLHAKLFVAETRAMSICMVTSANFTAQSLINNEIGLLIRNKGEGQQLVRRLTHEAAQIYRTDGRKLFSQREL
jgi:phosphatidylserine/phosphatidylglycerophosphate/cardiolipin synthase-like enzyme